MNSRTISVFLMTFGGVSVAMGLGGASLAATLTTWHIAFVFVMVIAALIAGQLLYWGSLFMIPER